MKGGIYDNSYEFAHISNSANRDAGQGILKTATLLADRLSAWLCVCCAENLKKLISKLDIGYLNLYLFGPTGGRIIFNRIPEVFNIIKLQGFVTATK